MATFPHCQTMQISGETARYELTHLNLYCLHNFFYIIQPIDERRMTLVTLTCYQSSDIMSGRAWARTLDPLVDSTRLIYSCLTHSNMRYCAIEL